MALWDRYLKGRDKPTAPAPVGHRPTDFDDDPRPQQPARGAERRTESRLDVTSGEAPSSDVTVVILGQRYRVRDLSVNGFSAYLSDDPKTPVTPSGPVTATVAVDNRTTELTVTLRHCTGDHMGFEIVRRAATWPFTVARLLGPERLGRSLREFPLTGIRSPEFGGPVRCFEGGPACSLWVWNNPENGVAAARLFFGDYVVEWLRGEVTRTGNRSPAFEVGPRYSKPEALELRTPPDSVVLETARQIIGAARLPPELCELLK